jgi:hypothetical protein
LVPGATLSPVFLSEEHRTFGNPISYLGGPRLQSPNTTRASKESVLSVDWSASCVGLESLVTCIYVLGNVYCFWKFMVVEGSCNKLHERTCRDGKSTFHSELSSFAVDVLA